MPKTQREGTQREGTQKERTQREGTQREGTQSSQVSMVSLQKLQEVWLRGMGWGGRDLEIRKWGAQPTGGVLTSFVAAQQGVKEMAWGQLQTPLTVPTLGWAS